MTPSHHDTRTLCAAYARRWAAALSLGLLTAGGLAAPAGGQEGRESHHWIVLLDVSASFEARAEPQSRPLGEGYRLRNETLSLLQTLLAARRVKEQELRDDLLSVYAFGEGVARVEELSTQPVRWAEVNDPEWWEAQMPTGLGARTNYFEALRRAVEDFRADPPGTVQHLVLISDGELDVEGENRAPGAPPAPEELAVYDNVLRRDTAPLNWLLDNGVEVHTLAVDEGLASYNENARQRDLKNTLFDYQAAGPTALERARVLVRDFAGRVGPDGKMAESEGPYVMVALAQGLNSISGARPTAERAAGYQRPRAGRSRSVRFDNVLDVLWETIFPEEVRWSRLPLGTQELVVFAPRDVPVPITIGVGGEETQTLSLIHDADRDSYRTDPPGTWPGLRVSVRTTDQYATWLIRHPDLREVDSRYRDLRGRTERFSIVPVNNVGFRWQEDRPPAQALADRPVPLTVDLVWTGTRPNPSRDEWRDYLSEIPLPLSAEMELPNGTASPLQLSPIVPRDNTDVVLRLTGEFQPELEGAHQARIGVRLGDHPESPELKADPILFGVLEQSPLSTPGRFVLHLRRWVGGEPAEAIPLPSAEARTREVAVLQAESDEPVTVRFEWWGRPDDECRGVERLRLRLPDFERAFDRDHNEVDPEAPPRDDDRVVCYRSPGVVVSPEGFGESFTVEAGDGLVEDLWWRWKVARKSLAWLWGLLALGALAVAGLLLFLFRERLRRALARISRRFPLALDVEDGDGVEWQPGESKRILVSAAPDGRLSAELTYRNPGARERAVEIELGRIRDNYLVRLGANTGYADDSLWTIERIEPDGGPGTPRPLSRTGETVRLFDLIRGVRLRLKLRESAALLRHQKR